MKLNSKRPLRNYLVTQKKAMTRRLAGRDLGFIVLGIIIIMLLVFLIYSIPRLKELVEAYPYLLGILFLFVTLLAVVAYTQMRKPPRFPACGTEYDALKFLYDTGTLECMDCGQRVPMAAVLKKDDIEIILRSLLESEDTADEDKEKIRGLMTREGLVIKGDKDLGAFG
jgi:hypothetical protein